MVGEPMGALIPETASCRIMLRDHQTPSLLSAEDMRGPVGRAHRAVSREPLRGR